MNKKVAILTQPLVVNYGGIMQAYALQRVVKSMGCDVVTVDRKSNKKRGVTWALSRGWRVARRLTSSKYRLLLSEKDMHSISGNPRRFIEQHIKQTELIRSDKQVVSHFAENHYDTIIIGSDQAWRPRYSPNIYNYYVDFESSAKQIISYASSFGSEKWEYSKEQTERCKELIKRFNAVSVRESSAVELCRKYLGVEAVHTLDPTMLLSKEHYTKLASSYKKTNSGVYTYILDESEKKDQIIEQCSKALDRGVFTSTPKASIYRRTSTNIDDYIIPPVEGWIKGFHDADFVITDSFHGCVFSIIFNKPFIAIANHSRGIARFTSLFSLFGLEDRLISSVDDLTDNLILKPMDYSTINEKLSTLQSESLSFIKNNI